MATIPNDGLNILQVMDWRFSQMIQMMTSHYRNLNSMVCNNLEQLNSTFGKLKVDMCALQRSTETNRVDIERTTEDIAIQNENWELVTQRLDKLEQLVDLNEVDLKCCNLRFMGVPEGGTTSFPMVDVIVEILNQYSYEGTWSRRDVNRAFRVGEWRDDPDNPRPVVVQMHRWTDKMDILQDQEMREALRKDNIRIASELTTRQRGMVDFHARQGKRAFFWKGKLQVEEKQEMFSHNRFPSHGPNKAHSDVHSLSQRNGRDTWPQTEESWVDRRSSRTRYRKEEPRVVPGHKTYSQVVREGRNDARSTVKGIHTSKNFAHRVQHAAPNISGWNRRSNQDFSRGTQTRDEHRRIFIKAKGQLPPRPRQKGDETAQTKAVQSRSTAVRNERKYSETGSEEMNNSRNPIYQDSAEGKADERGHGDDQLSQCSSESDIDPPSSNEDDVGGNSDIPLQDVPCTAVDNHQKSHYPETEQDLPATLEPQRQREQMENGSDENRPAADTETECVAESIDTQQPASNVDGVIQDKGEAENPSVSDTTDRQKKTTKDPKVTKRPSRSTAKTKAQESTPARMSTRAGTSKERSCSQTSIKEAFKRNMAEGGSHSKERDRVKKGLTPSHNQTDCTE